MGNGNCFHKIRQSSPEGLDVLTVQVLALLMRLVTTNVVDLGLSNVGYIKLIYKWARTIYIYINYEITLFDSIKLGMKNR